MHFSSTFPPTRSSRRRFYRHAPHKGLRAPRISILVLAVKSRCISRFGRDRDSPAGVRDRTVFFGSGTNSAHLSVARSRAGGGRRPRDGENFGASLPPIDRGRGRDGEETRGLPAFRAYMIEGTRGERGGRAGIKFANLKCKCLRAIAARALAHVAEFLLLQRELKPVVHGARAPTRVK